MAIIIVQNGIKYIDYLTYYGNATISGQSIWVFNGTSIKSRVADKIVIVGPKYH